LGAIDISFVSEIFAGSAASEAIEGQGRDALIALVAEDCDIDDARVASLFSLTNLTTLRLHGNDIESIDTIVDLSRHMPSLTDLDLRENPVASDMRALREACSAAFPRLRRLCNDSVKVTGGVGLASVSADDFCARMAASEHLESTESCPCLEGTPCQLPETCKDWEHRFDIAAQCREKR
jgi:hypothetical protein